MAAERRIRVGIGGWSYEPWRETFYPKDVKKTAELDYASRKVTAIEINSTFYRMQTPAVYAKWRDATPEDFVFTLKAPRFVTQRKVLGEGVEGAKRFIESGIGEFGEKLGALMWQLDSAHEFDEADLSVFLKGLPRKIGKIGLRHALNVRHESFRDERFVEIAREFNIAVVCDDDAKMDSIADLTSEFVYARLRRSEASHPTGYAGPALDEWARRARLWVQGADPEDLPHVSVGATKATPRDVFVFFINGAKERAPAAAQALLARLKESG